MMEVVESGRPEGHPAGTGLIDTRPSATGIIDTRPSATGIIDTAATPKAGGQDKARLCAMTGRELLGLARWYALDLPPWLYEGRAPLGERHYELVQRNTNFEVWLIQWPLEVGLELHDHGGSSGAFHVVSGVLQETSAGPTSMRQRVLRPGEGVSFGPRYIHSVVNPELAMATSVHAYSPPLSAMTFYEHSGAEGLVPTRTETQWKGAP